MSWRRDTLEYLRGMLRGCRSVIENNSGVSGLELVGVQEWTVPWGMDDGIIVVRLTVIRDPESTGRNLPIRGRVVVAAGARGFGWDGFEVELPRYTDEFSQVGRSVDLNGQDRSLTKSLTLDLLGGVDGELASIREEAGGALSFTLPLVGR
ncbi:hypothetical protein ACIRD9_21665 [Streptomyces violaceus]|jgi:hypothetical protein|uniref:hypothetical protein n=1 Tax=Streptomyces violaceus TaxID=1936 RepID=UPI003808FD3F